MDLEKGQKNGKTGGMQELNFKKYTAIAFVAFVTFCCCSLAFFVIYRYDVVASSWQKLMGILQPIIMGFIVAYLLNPVMIFLERHLMRFLGGRMKDGEKVKKWARSLGTIGSLLFLLFVIFLLLYMMIPELAKSIQNMMINIPAQVREFEAWADRLMAKDSQMTEWMSALGIDLASAGDYAGGFLEQQILPKVMTYLTYLGSITTGVISALKLLFNFIVGLIIAVYLLTTKETLIGQSKKVIYACMPPRAGNAVIRTMRISHKMFGGFVSGKILDSAIIGLICYIGLVILRIPYSLLVAVIVGVTNVIPFFGPFIGAVPSFILVALADPMKGLYFLVFVFVLQQVDGNIIGPKILGDSTGLSAFWVVFAILTGGGMFGFMGMLLGVPTFAVIYHLLRELVSYILRRRALPEGTADYIRMREINPDTGKLQYSEEESNIPQQS